MVIDITFLGIGVCVMRVMMGGETVAEGSERRREGIIRNISGIASRLDLLNRVSKSEVPQ